MSVLQGNEIHKGKRGEVIGTREVERAADLVLGGQQLWDLEEVARRGRLCVVRPTTF